MLKSKFIHAHMKAAEVYAQLSSAKRLQVGCVIVKNDTIIGIGYNGMPSGWTNVCEETEYILKSECQFDPEDMLALGYTETENGWMKLQTKPEVLHAESNSLAKVAKSTNSSEGADMFVTHAPCLQCAKLIHQAGIISVFYREAYRDVSGIEFLKKCGVYVEQIENV